MVKTMPTILCLVNSPPCHILPCRSCFQWCGQRRSRGLTLVPASQTFLSRPSLCRTEVGREGACLPCLPRCLQGQKTTASGRVKLLLTALAFSKIIADFWNSLFWIPVGGKGHSSVCLKSESQLFPLH